MSAGAIPADRTVSRVSERRYRRISSILLSRYIRNLTSVAWRPNADSVTKGCAEDADPEKPADAERLSQPDDQNGSQAEPRLLPCRRVRQYADPARSRRDRTLGRRGGDARSVRLPVYGADDGAALRDILFTWWEQKFLGAAESGAPAIGDRKV
jgi:hypothetical protein